MNIADLQKEIYDNARSKKWFRGVELYDAIEHIGDEVHEALVETSNPHGEDLENEMADIICMTLSAAAEFDIDIIAGLQRTLEKLKARP